MKKIILVVALALLPFALANVAEAKPTNENTQHSDTVVTVKKKIVKKHYKRKKVVAKKVAPEKNAFLRCATLDLTCGKPAEVVATNAFVSNDEETSASYWRKEYERNNPIAKPSVKLVDSRVDARKKCSWFTCENGVFMEAKRWEGKTAGSNKQELKNLFVDGKVPPIDPARIPWCAAFANAILNRQGYEGTKSLLARSFLHWGTKTTNPEEGDVVVLKRGNNKFAGHVGFFRGFEYIDGVQYVVVLGGNQQKSVSVGYFPASSVLGYRKPTPVAA